jgi:hypothetical protein
MVDANHASARHLKIKDRILLDVLAKLCSKLLDEQEASIESSTFGSKFTAMKHCCPYL